MAGHTVVYDSSDGVSKGISPMRAVLTSLGACSGMDVAAILKKRKQKVTSIRVLLTGTRPDYGYPKPWETITMKYEIAGEGLEKKYVTEAVEDSMSKFCSVAATLRPGVKISYTYEILG